MGSSGTLAKPGNYPDEVTDPASGANILAFPVGTGFVDSYEARNDDGDLLALILAVDEL